MTNRIFDSTQAEAFRSADEAGREYAKGLKVGDEFVGTSVEAKRRYPDDSRLQRIFSWAALDILDRMTICTAGDGTFTLTRIAPERSNA